MEAIYFKDGIYVFIDYFPNNVINKDYCIYHWQYIKSATLYGGRVTLEYNFNCRVEASFEIDHIPIIKIDSLEKNINSFLHLSEIVAHLNAIEANGIDAFLENYKKSIEFLYREFKDMDKKTESQIALEQDSSKVETLLSELTEIRNSLFSFLAILFSLYTYMTAGLDNEKVISVYQSIMDSLS